jgi:hypothetical protein
MRKNTISVVLLLVVAALGLAVAGCGGSDNKTSGGTTAATTEVATTTEATTTEAATTVAATTVAATTTSTDVSGVASAANCRELAGLGAKLGQALSGAGGGDIEAVATFLKQFADKTPADIRADFQVVADAYAKIATALKGVNLTPGQTPSADVIARLSKLGQELDQAKLAAASQHIAAWVQKNCHA